MRRLATTTLLVLSLLLSLAVLNAQQADVITANTSVPNLIRYSGTLHNIEGAATSSATPQGVTFSIYKQQDGGAAVWQETQNVTLDSNGQYNVILGSTTATGLPDDLFSQQEQRWLGVQVQGQAEQPRVLLVSVPYAFKAHEADTLGGLPASAFVKAPPADQSGDTAVNAAATATTTTAAAGQVGSKKKLPPGPCNPQAGFLTYWDSTGALCASSLLQIANGNIGIGVTNPSEPLDVAGPISTYQWYDINENRILSVNNTGAAPSGSTNLYVGWGAGASNSGDTNDNTFVGWKAGLNNSSGNNNTFVGESAGISDTTGKLNTFAGAEAGFAHSTGDTNAFFGFRSGKNNGSGNADTFIGYQAGYENNGNNNTIVGRSAGFNSRGSNNVCVGVSACYNNAASNNTFVGYNSGVGNTSGGANTFIGNQAGTAITTQAGNTFVGNNAGLNVSASSECCATIVGDAAGTNSSGGDFFGYEAGFNSTGGGVFMGYKSGFTNTTGIYNAFFGVNSGFYNQTGNQNTYLGSGAGSSSNTTSGSNNIFVGFAAGNGEGNVSNNIEIGNSGPAPAGSNSILIGTETGGMNQTYIAGIYQQQSLTNTRSVVIDATGHLGTSTGGGGGTVNGSCTSPSGGTYLSLWAPGSPATTIGCGLPFQQNTTNFIGIGTTNPGVQLDVNGDINALLDQSSYRIGLNTVLSAYGDRDTFLGFAATPLNCVNTTGNCEQNTFAGANAGSSNTNGSYNTYLGSGAGNQDTTGSANTFLGQGAGFHTTTSGFNTFVGEAAGFSSFTGSNNAYLGDSTGGSNESGNNNIFLGSNAGARSLTGSNDIYIGHVGCTAPCNESNTLRIGLPYSNVSGNCGDLVMPCGQKIVFMEPLLFNPNPANSGDVVVDVSTGQLGFIGSSRRFKEQIADMGDSSSNLFRLRPVTFLYKAEYDSGTRKPQYGLIAEEVAKVYPDLVAYDKDGQPLTVKYQVLAPMLLNELQKEHKMVIEQQEELQTQLQQIQAQRQELDTVKRELETQNASLQERLQRLESYVETQMKTASATPPVTSSGSNGGLQ